MDLLKQLRDYRLSHLLSLRDLEALTGISFATLSRLMRGTTEPDACTEERLRLFLAEGKRPAKRIKRKKSSALQERLRNLEARIARLERSMRHD